MPWLKRCRRGSYGAPTFRIRMRPTRPTKRIWLIWCRNLRQTRWCRSACWWTIRRGFMVSTNQKQREQNLEERRTMEKGFFASIARRAVLLMLAAAVLPASLAQAAWPEKAIKVVLPFGAGGVADVTARILADKLSQKLNQRVVVENMPGPGGIAAARAVITSPPDGYTMAWVTNGAAISAATFQSLPFDPTKDFAMVSMAGTFDLVFVVNS